MLRLDRIVLTQGAFSLTADLTIPAGGTTALIGPSGAGKSTLLAAIAGFLAPVSGRILWGDAEITALPPARRPVTILFQDHNLFPHLTVAQNVGLGLDPRLRLSGAQRVQVEDALVRTGLGGFGARRPAQLSGGQQSRVALARALLRARPLLLLDEPFAALGPALKDEMLDLVAALAGDTGATVLLVSHDPDDARRIAGQTVLVADGVAHAPQPTAQLLDHPPEALRRYLGGGASPHQ